MSQKQAEENKLVNMFFFNENTELRLKKNMYNHCKLFREHNKTFILPSSTT